MFLLKEPANWAWVRWGASNTNIWDLMSKTKDGKKLKKINVHLTQVLHYPLVHVAFDMHHSNGILWKINTVDKQLSWLFSFTEYSYIQSSCSRFKYILVSTSVFTLLMAFYTYLTGNLTRHVFSTWFSSLSWERTFIECCIVCYKQLASLESCHSHTVLL